MMTMNEGNSRATSRDDSSHNDDANIVLPERESMLLSLLGITSRAPPFAMDYLTVRDRLPLLAVSTSVRAHLLQIEYSRCKDGRLYKVPFPGFPGLLEHRPGDGLFPHQLASLQAMYRAENPTTTEGGILRGGILGDAPGLGKSITMLALMTSTAGKRPQAPGESSSLEDIQQGWIALSSNPAYGHGIRKVLKPFRSLLVYRQLEKDTIPPFPLERFPSIRDFEKTIRQTAQQSGATEIELEQFRQNMRELQAGGGIHKSRRSKRCRISEKREAWERSLVPASTTLLVVPDALFEHWFQQIHEHLDRDLYCSTADGRGVVWLDGLGDMADARMPLGDVHCSKQAPFPKPWELAQYMIVVTTFSRCEHEYAREVALGNLHGGKTKLATRKRSIDEMTNSTVNKKKSSRHREGIHDDDDDVKGESFSSSLLNVRWLRVVVDEGHELGTHQGGTGVTRFVHQVAAERRWVLSGTPTTGDEDDIQFSAKALDQIQRLLVFLRHSVYGKMPTSNSNGALRSLYVGDGSQASRNQQKKQAKDAWVANVKQPFIERKAAGRTELLNVLRSVAVLHRKEDVHLPKPIFRDIALDVPLPDEVQENIRTNQQNAEILLAAYLQTNEFQELVDRAQGECIIEAIEKAKKDLMERGGALPATEQSVMKMMTEYDLNTPTNDRRPVKAVIYSSSKFNLRDVTEVLYSKLSYENIAEAYDDPGFDCGAELSRFRHNQREVRLCPICNYQNGFEGTAKELRSSPKCQNYLMEVVLPTNENIRFLVETERVVRAVPIAEGGNVPLSRLGGKEYADHNKYAMDRKAWRAGDILEVNIMDPHPLLKKRESQETWDEYGAVMCMDLAQRDFYYGQDWFLGPLPDEGDNHIVQVCLKKWQQCSKFHNHARWYKGPRLADIPLEPRVEDTFILSLDAGLAHGLDLSFVTHIFLLEPVDDAALLEQITSRAHRLGATGSVTVVTVNPYYKLDPATEDAVRYSRELSLRSNSKKKCETGKVVELRNKTALTKAVCQYCYRQFDTMEKALLHENAQCGRNPENIDAVDPWHVSSVYREICPPPPQTMML